MIKGAMMFFHQVEKARKEDEEAKKKADDDARKKMILSNLSFTGYKVIILFLFFYFIDTRHTTYCLHITTCVVFLTRHRLGQRDKRKEKRRRRS